MGYRNADICYATSQEAVDAYFSGIPPVIAAGNTTLHYSFVKVADAWNFQKLSYGSNGAESLVFLVPAPAFTPTACTMPNDPITQFQDGMTLGWAVAAAMVAVYVIRRPYR